MAGPRFDPEAARAYAAEICRRGRLLGIRVIGLGSPPARRIPETYDGGRAAAELREFVRLCAEEGAKRDITFLLEALNPSVCNLLTHTREALHIVRELDMANLRMVLDFHHVERSGESVEDIAYVMPYVEHLHIDHTREDGRYHLEPGGIPFYRRCISAARACGYDRTLSIEPTAARGAFREEAGESLRILRSLLS
jgi:sugar phosphate isomerase/epimerase